METEPNDNQPFHEFLGELRDRVKSLHDSSPLAAQVLALRCAARVFPVIGYRGHFKFWKQNASKHVQAIEKCLYLNSLFLYAKVRNKSSLESLRKELRTAYDTAYDAAYAAAYVADDDAAYAAADAAAYVAADDAAYAAAYAATAAYDATAAANFNLYQKQFEADYKYLEESKTDDKRIALLKKPLWNAIDKNDFTEKWQSVLDNFRKALQSISLPRVFDFYEEMLKSGFDSERIQNYIYGEIRYHELLDKKTEKSEQSILAKTENNNAAKEDKIGFANYVKGMVEFLKHPEKPGDFPLTFSVEGAWGSGKSSFMLQLKEALKEEKEPFITIWYNPWKNDKDEALWASFILHFKKQIAKQTDWFRQQWIGFSLGWKTIRWMLLVPELLLWWTFALIAIFFLGSMDSNFLTGSMKESWDDWSLLIGTVVALLLKFTDSLRRVPLAFQSNINRYFNEKNYEQRLCALENAHRDFMRIAYRYAKEKTTVVFIDDLDRCEVPKAAELLQAIQLITSPQVEDTNKDEEKPPPRIIFILGIDREKVAAGVTVKYENLVTYLFPESDDKDKKKKGLHFGHEFIEKFIDVTFRLPKPSKETCMRLVLGEKQESVISKTEGINENVDEEKKPLDSDSKSEDTPTGNDQKGSDAKPSPEKQVDKRKTKLEKTKKEIADDSPLMKAVVPMAAELLDYNPRRVKHFVNLFRLYAYTNFDNKTEENFTLEQLAKVIALSFVHPQLLKDMEDDTDLLKKLRAYLKPESEEEKENEQNKKLFYWVDNPEINRKRTEAVFFYQENDAAYNLEKFNVEKLVYCNPTL